ncbi:BlaI/MecI/CopY family transcriptional regulator [Clostridioides difficile]|nr:BlaI/MecI/CopY family transcriptional regulator [Clostridioides difficile]MBH7490340.1 BlaI/MecI/CopY family transcriptional regulator [Clostridioides difficile]MBY1673108.1 BlaI/MecI/CopY family transcriptional regulator [Clostridioides difficile]MBY1795605.1 BlaI/MecI/CopY family transcriptional regulator [Clostridioides difficile]MBY1998873.1 BlaI/MecI/CopY family transcriptional regulator [Clostridioides difficile]
MGIKLVDSELKVMDVLWKEGDSTAKHISDVMIERYGWNINTTYTLLKRCVKKGAVERQEPNFVCHALVQQEQIQALETDELLNKIFDGSVDKLFASLLSRKKLTTEQIEKLKCMVDKLGGNEK